MSYSYVKCCEESVVWDISKLPHEGIRASESNIIHVHSLLRERGACESSFPASLYGCADLLEEGGSGGELLWSSGAGHGASIALQTWSCPDPSQLRQKTAAGKKKRSCKETHCISVPWDYLEFRSIKQNKLLE